jgi:putative oxidoreductase
MPEKDKGRLKLEQVGRELKVPAGTCVVRQGDPPYFFYVILSGELKVYRETPDGIRTNLTDLGPGDYFGEVALVTGQARTATVEAVTESVLLEINKEEFDLVLDQNPKLARQIIHRLSEWLVQGDRRLEQETVHQAKIRQISWFDYALTLALSLVFALIFNFYNQDQIPLIHGWGESEKIPEVTLDKARQLYEKGEAVFVDARKSAFYDQRHIKGAINLPVLLFDLQYPMFEYMLTQKQVSKDRPLIVYGGSFSRRVDVELARLLKDRDFEKVMVLGGGYSEWQRVLPVEGKDKVQVGAMPLGIPGLIEWIPVGIFAVLLIPPLWRSPYLSIFGRLLLGVIFIQFALSKIMRPAVFALNVVDYGMMPEPLVNLWALFLPWAELLAGLFLILGIRTRANATIIGAMNVIFIIGLVNAIFLNLPINCGCVGETGEPVTWWKVLKNTGMLVIALQIFLYDRFFVLDRGGFTWGERQI